MRVSTDKQEELSPDAQKRLLLDYARKNNIIISEDFIFLENGISGKRADKRPEFQKMIGYAKSKEHPIDVILVWKFSRFARNQEESIVYKSLLKKNYVDVISVSEPLIDGPFGSLIERIIEWMDEYYSIRLSGEVFRGMTENAMRGKYQCSSPLGYQIKDGLPVIVSEEACIIKKIFEMYVNENKGMHSIAKELNESGCRTKTGGKFERRSIEYILKNPLYYGMVRWNYAESGMKKIKDKSEWIIKKGKHEPIITEELWQSAANRYESEYRPKKQQPSGTYKHWLSGLVKCSACGSSLSTSLGKSPAGKKYMYFQCYQYRKGKCTVSHQISAMKLEKAVLDGLHEILASGILSYKKIRKNEAADTDLIRINNLLTKLDAKEKRMKAAYLDGIDTLEEYKANKTMITGERNRFLSELSSLTQRTTTAPEQEREDFLKEIKNVYDILTSEADVSYKAEILRKIVKSIDYDRPQDTLTIHLYTPDKLAFINHRSPGESRT
ncbi:MAG: recombinase family protein [Lachnospiraceae bacterium]|nr:recombinase family protein [Lachnospiraceae bacterium]